MEPFSDSEIEIRPDGLIYLPHDRVRLRLNEAFGPGGWRMVELEPPKAGSREVIWRWRMETRDGWSGTAVGHAVYYSNNSNASYGDACETAKSDALVRICKDLGLGLQCWSRDYQIAWIQRYAVQVPMLSGREMKWRRKDRPPLQGERVSERQHGPDYEHTRDFHDDAREHLDSMTEEEDRRYGRED